MRVASILPVLVVACAGVAGAQDASRAPPEDAGVDRKTLEESVARCDEVARVSSGTKVYDALVEGAFHAFHLAEPGGDASSDWARRGFERADRARRLDPARVEAHYAYALCLGIYLRENRLSGLTRLSDLLAAARRAVEIDERYDRGGPHRLLAILHAEAPRFVGPGDRDLARKHLDRLLAVAGDDEENKLVAVRVQLAIGDERRARSYLATVDPDKAPDEATRRERRAELERLRKALDD